MGIEDVSELGCFGLVFMWWSRRRVRGGETVWYNRCRCIVVDFMVGVEHLAEAFHGGLVVCW
jgi:hypothetical protein